MPQRVGAVDRAITLHHHRHRRRFLHPRDDVVHGAAAAVAPAMVQLQGGEEQGGPRGRPAQHLLLTEELHLGDLRVLPAPAAQLQPVPLQQRLRRLLQHHPVCKRGPRGAGMQPAGARCTGTPPGCTGDALGCTGRHPWARGHAGVRGGAAGGAWASTGVQRRCPSGAQGWAPVARGARGGETEPTQSPRGTRRCQGGGARPTPHHWRS